MTERLRIGTRRSKLALTQSGMMQRAIAAAMGVTPADVETAVPLVHIVTTGDRVQDRRLLEIGGKAMFTKEIEEALLDGRVDVAIHSMKDVPAIQPPGLMIAAIPEREDARDAFVSHHYETFADLPMGARLGTASLRRGAQALALRPDLQIEMLRGNVDTRLQRLADGDFDAILLATSGLNRLGLSGVICERLSLDTFLPAPGQGALAIQTREGEADRIRNADWVAALNHPLTSLAVAAERGAMVALEGSCHTAMGAHATIADGRMLLTAEMLAPDGSARWRRSGELLDIEAADAEASAALLGETIGSQIQAVAGDQRVDA
ncbi:hydroxymethylbilane synthase [Brevundimonas variabilis]|uniref:Porphobilinogen deaminase n=1 Tax=Brevundimonas variabilis TaxID=74312 RepID=A0A7W9FF63_9CAUL|nr:hydroxymethylbilane synthase [Brevundimonas variabilis]MBB5745243.1 hydroxymethylbilane synthase [Brevundimonas variabilis]